MARADAPDAPDAPPRRPPRVSDSPDLHVLPLMLAAALTVPAGPPRPCADLQSCVAALVRTAPERCQARGRRWAPARLVRVAGPAAAPALVDLLGRGEGVRESAAFALSLLGDAARPAVPALARAARAGSGESLRALA